MCGPGDDEDEDFPDMKFQELVSEIKERLWYTFHQDVMYQATDWLNMSGVERLTIVKSY
jgi:radical SAM superfamily enzyme YgiQ (UPF0313 family)